MAVGKRIIGAVGKRIIGAVERSMFQKDGNYFRIKARMAKAKEEKRQVMKGVEKKDLKIVGKSLALYRNAMEKTGHLPPAERAKILEKAEDIIHESVKKTYNDKAEKQSFAHQTLFGMTAKLAMERMRLEKK